MSSRFNREDGTFALVDYGDLSGSAPSVGSVVVSIGSVSGVIGVASGIAMAGSNVVASVGSGLAHSAGAIIVNVSSGIAFSSGALVANAIGFSAHKNGTNQTGLVEDSVTIVTFGTEVYDVGSYFASNAWIPPSGQVAMTATVLENANPVRSTLSIYKNGAEFKSSRTDSSRGVSVAIFDVANGTDSYGVRISINNGGAAIPDLVGSTTATYFMGHWIGT